MKLTYLLLLIFMSASCGTIEIASEDKYREILDKLVGDDIKGVIDEYGYADNVSRSPNGNKLYIYSYSSTSSTPVSCTENSKGETDCSGGNTSHNWCKTFFEVDNNNIVIAYSFKGNHCRWCLSDDVLLCM